MNLSLLTLLSSKDESDVRKARWTILATSFRRSSSISVQKLFLLHFVHQKFRQYSNLANEMQIFGEKIQSSWPTLAGKHQRKAERDAKSGSNVSYLLLPSYRHITPSTINTIASQPSPPRSYRPPTLLFQSTSRNKHTS